MQALENAAKTTKEKLDEAVWYENFHAESIEKWSEKVQEYKDQMDDIERAKVVLKEHGY